MDKRLVLVTVGALAIASMTVGGNPAIAAQAQDGPSSSSLAKQEARKKNCTPGYKPCLPPASDYDCYGGSGNGPAYTGRVKVKGYDVYGLDSDGDGIGCETVSFWGPA
ncbi:MAG: hypothetical protein ACKOBJ_06745 [Actinomycetota bacterium]